jgi:hypothetical protein
MRLIRRGIWLGLVAFTSGLAVAVPATAQTLGPVIAPQPGMGNVTGGDVTPVGAAPAMTQQAKAKVAATLAWDAAMKAGNTAGAAKTMNAYTAQWGGAGAGIQAQSMSETQSAAVMLPTLAPPPASRILGVVQVGQQNGFFCGPASGYMIIRFLHGAGFRSRFDGSAPGQAGLGNANHMATTANRVTAWATGRYVTGVNRWRGGRDYVQVNAPSATLLNTVFRRSIGAQGMPFAGDTVEFAGGAHYNGHPNRTIGHWITAYGYSTSGAVGRWADSSTTRFPAAQRTFSYNTASFSRFLRSNGIAF